MERIVVVGAGLAAAHAVETLREEGYWGPLTVVGNEPLLPYERPQLSKDVLQGKEFQVLHDAAWYAEHEVRVLTHTSAERLDLASRTVVLDDGQSLGYDALLLATGARPRVPSIPGVERAHVLRTWQDEQRLQAAIRPGARLVVVGGGWIGLEVAASARQQGTEVTVLERSDAPLARVLGPRLAEHLLALHRGHGVDVRTGVDVTAITPDGVVTSDGEISADAVLLAVGATPRTELAEAAGLSVTADGVVADSRLRTSDPDVWVAGDVALATHTTLGALRVEHWDDAIRQGRAAARSMLGDEVAYDWQPYVFTDQFEFSMEYVGHSSPTDRVELRGDVEQNAFIAYWLGGEDGRTVTAGMNVGIWDVNDTLREMIGTTVDPDQLTDLR